MKIYLHFTMGADSIKLANIFCTACFPGFPDPDTSRSVLILEILAVSCEKALKGFTESAVTARFDRTSNQIRINKPATGINK